MTRTLDAARSSDRGVEAPARSSGRSLRVMLLAIIVAAALVIAGGVGWLSRGDGSGGSAGDVPGTSSVDAGFARDMATHHTQAVTMAGYERDNTTNPSLKTLAFDIETSQESQVGEFQGWLDSWNQSRNSPHPMAWMGSAHMHMGSDGLMPGMATPAQMTELESLHGKALDIFFLQLMIRHHQGGVPMAQYAAAHANEDYVRTVAAHIVSGQSAEIIEMEQLLRQLGGAPLPAPS